MTLAGEVGAPTQTVSKSCAVNIQIIFTPDPQQLLDHIAVDYRPLLGFYYQSQRAQVTTFTGPIKGLVHHGHPVARIPDPPASAPEWRTG